MLSVFDIDFEHILTDCQSNTKCIMLRYWAEYIIRLREVFPLSLFPLYLSRILNVMGNWVT